MSRVRLLLFAAAREAAGRSNAELEATDVGGLLDAARASFGPAFDAVLGTCRVWVNGDEPSDGDATELRDGDEVAVLPPISGGCAHPSR